MATLKITTKTGALIAASFILSGCDKLKAIDELQVNSATNNQQVIEIKDELTSVRVRLLALEAAQKKTANKNEPQPLSAERVQALEKSIIGCVQSVRSSTPNDSFFAQFDAYYNPASQRVDNNVIYNGSRPALYAFNKCMTHQGFAM